MRATINKIDKELRELANAHLQINSYFYGQFLDIYESNRVNHTSLLANITNATVDRHYVNLSLGLMVCDKIDNGKSIATDVDSETLRILNDLIKVITTSNRWQEFGVVTDTATCQNFSQKGGSVLNGWFTTLNLKIKNENGYCDLPIVDYSYEPEPEPTPEPEPIVCLPEYGEPFSIINAQFNNVIDGTNSVWKFGQVLESDELIGTYNISNNTFTNAVTGIFEFILETDISFSGTAIVEQPFLSLNYVEEISANCDTDNWVTQVGETITYVARYSVNLQTINTPLILTSNVPSGASLTQLSGGTLKIGYQQQ